MTGRHRQPPHIPETLLIVLSAMVVVAAVIAWAIIR